MASEKVIPTERELEKFDLTDDHTVNLIQQAELSDQADRQLTIRQALKKYKKAVFWAMFLSTALVMEGYDLVIVSAIFHQIQLKPVRTNQSVLDHLILRPDPVQRAIR